MSIVIGVNIGLLVKLGAIITLVEIGKALGILGFRVVIVLEVLIPLLLRTL